MKTYLAKITDILSQWQSRPGGLSDSEAEARRAEVGFNKLADHPRDPLWRKFFQQMADPMILILIVAAIISGFTSFYAGESFSDVIIILFVVMINAVLGVFQETKAEKSIDALQAMTAATSRVLRDGMIRTIPSEELVPGDIVIFEAGDAVPADGRIIESASLQVEEAALTGESLPVHKIIDALSLQGQKDIPLGDRINMVYMGSTVVYGRGKAMITDIGMSTEMGKIADALVNAKEEQTPLQRKLGQLSKILSIMVISICLFIFGISLLRSYPAIDGHVILDTFMIAVSLAVAAIPEGLAAVVTIVLSMGVTHMSHNKAIIRKLTAVETLGCTQTICSDKTGTLTQNKMTVVEHRAADETALSLAMSLCSDAFRNASGFAEGEPTECALVNDAFQMDLVAQEQRYQRVAEAPFDSGRKMMSVICRDAEDRLVQFTKGAPDVVLQRCSHYWDGQQALPMTESLRRECEKANQEMASRALRVLCAAQKQWRALPTEVNPEQWESGLCYLGLSGMMDPIRPEVRDAISECREAGITPVMITGDHRDTAIAIARQLGMLTDEAQALTGVQLDEMDDETLVQTIDQYTVYARVQPEHKVRIVQAWKQHGHITAMTGDGVNDAPSIKRADIGVGMGITGTDVTKNVADMVLADDNFATIVSAVEEGRRIYDNIRKAVQFLLSSNLAEVLSIFLATLLGFHILQPVHLLWINLITDCFPALALGMERSEPDIMSRAPRNAKDGIFAGGMGLDTGYQGIIIAALTLLSYFIGHYLESGVWEIVDSPDGMTMAFLTLSLVEIFHSFNMRSRRKSIFQMHAPNRWLWASMIASLVCTTGVIYIPFFAEAFDFQPISALEYAVALGLAVSIIPIVEGIKALQRHIAGRRGEEVH